MRRILPLLLPTAVLFAFAFAPRDALAQPPDADPFENQPFVYAAPGVAGIAFGDDEADAADDLLELNYTTQVGGGYLVRSSTFMAAFGAAAELMVYNFDEPGNLDADGVMLRLLPEIRVGGGVDWFFIYGVVKPGFALSHVDWNYHNYDFDCGPGRPNWWCYPGFDGDGDDYEDTAPGFDLGVGGGAAFKVWRGLGVGAESGFDFAFFGDDHPFERVFVADFIMYAGWWF
jgi:hypothetical protein